MEEGVCKVGQAARPAQGHSSAQARLRGRGGCCCISPSSVPGASDPLPLLILTTSLRVEAVILSHLGELRPTVSESRQNREWSPDVSPARPTLTLSLPSARLGKERPTQGLGACAGASRAHCWDVAPSPENVPTAGNWSGVRELESHY